MKKTKTWERITDWVDERDGQIQWQLVFTVEKYFF